MRKRFALAPPVLALGIAAFLWGAAPPSSRLPLRLVKDYPLPGRTTRFDYESFDPKTGLLFIAHLGDGQVLAFDTKAQKLAADIPGVPAVHGVLAIPSLGRVYASATGVDEVFAIDERTFKIVAKIPGGHYPDGLAFDPSRGELFVSDEHGRTDTVIDTRKEQRIATIKLGGEAGNTQFDPETDRMYVAVQTLNLLVAIDARTKTIANRYPLPGCERDHGLYIDAPHRLAFVACEGNAKLVTFDLRTLRATGLDSVGDDPDVLAFDEGLQRLYVASESGVMAIFQEKARGAFKLGQDFLADNAHSVALDAQRRVYIPLRNYQGRPLLRVWAPSD